MATTVTFLTLFLGLTTGLQPILVDVDGDVARVEVQLDGEVCGNPRTLPPWHFNCDFGSALAPHELTAVAFDEAGAEVARATQAINVTPRQAEAELILERDSQGRPIALQVAWESVEFDHPSGIELTFDDRPIEVVDPRFVPLPLGVNFAGIHFATTVVSFPDGSSATADLAFGGRFGDSVSAENTAVPLELDRREALRNAADAGGLLVAGGEAARPLVLENPGADLVAVVEESAQETLLSFNRYFRHTSGWDRRGAGMRPRDRFFLVRPTPERGEERAGSRSGGEVQREIFRSSPARGASEGGLAWQLTHVHFPPTGGRQQLADAVAIAGMQAAGGDRPRAVVLVLGPGLASGDASRHDAASVRRFLDALRVPLHVWWVELKSNRRDALPRRLRAQQEDDPQTTAAALAEAEAAWGPVERISTFQGLVGASRRLRDEVDRQRILWIEGGHLPHQLATSTRAGEHFPGVDLLAGGTAVPAPPWAEGADLESLARLARADDEVPEALRDEGVRRAVEALDVVPVSLPGGPTLLPPGSMKTFQDALDVRLVEVEAVVTDRAGRPVGGLTRDDFVVYEDGEAMAISHFSVGAGAAAPAAEGIEPGAVHTPTPPAALSEPFHLVIYLDDAQMTAERRNRMLARLRE
ncbi:MAG TPA: hypothetical protein VKU40_05035, partial [Thermoanaerobaculia bacterium]|nr:hypothetical protein [Thermoanaerobaculia bacterium]